MESDWIVDHGPYSEFGDLLTLRGAQFIGAGYNIPNIRGLGRTVATNHAWGSAFRAYGSPQSVPRLREPDGRAGREDGHGSAGVALPERLSPRRHHPHRPGARSLQLPEMLDKLRPIYKAAKEKRKAESTPDKKEGRRHLARHLRLRPGRRRRLGGQRRADPGRRDHATTTWQDHGQGADMGTLGTGHEALRPLGSRRTRSSW